MLTALFLFQFGTGPVKGFAVTLIVGIFASLVTAVFVTRTFYMIWLQRKPDLKELSVGKIHWFKGAKYDFIGVRRYAYGITGAILAAGLVFLAIRGINYSIEFTGGTLLQIRTTAQVSDASLRTGLDAQGIRGAESQEFGAPGEFVVRARVAKVLG